MYVIFLFFVIIIFNLSWCLPFHKLNTIHEGQIQRNLNFKIIDWLRAKIFTQKAYIRIWVQGTGKMQAVKWLV